MSVKIRLARYGAKKDPYYHIVAADSRSKRDGKFLKTLGKYNPQKATIEEKVINLDVESIKYWLSQGAEPTDVVHKLLASKGILEAKPYSVKTKKSLPKAKAQERMKAMAAAEAPKETVAEAPAPAEEAKSE